MSKLPKVLVALLTWLIFTLVVWQIPYPKSLTAAGIGQIFPFFMPLFLAITFTLNIFLNMMLLSAIISLGLVFGLILKALDSFNLVTIALILVAEYLLISSFKKNKHKIPTRLPKIKKITH